MHQNILLLLLGIQPSYIMIIIPAGILRQSLSQTIDLVICRSCFILETFILIRNYCQLFQFRNQILVFALKFLTLYVWFLKMINFGLECRQIVWQAIFFVIGFCDLNRLIEFYRFWSSIVIKFLLISWFNWPGFAKLSFQKSAFYSLLGWGQVADFEC